MSFHAAGSRRDFLAAVAGMGATMVLRSTGSRAADDVEPRVAELVAGTIGIDTHNHIDVPLTAAEVPGPDLDLAGEMKRPGLSAIYATFAFDYQRLGEPGGAGSGGAAEKKPGGPGGADSRSWPDGGRHPGATFAACSTRPRPDTVKLADGFGGPDGMRSFGKP